MKITPKTEEQIAAEGVLAPGVYSFEVMKAEEKTSKSGNPMIVLDVKLFGPDGEPFYVNDYLLEKFAFKLRHFCAMTGLLDAYQQGSLTAGDCEGRTGHAKVAIDKGKPNPQGGNYPDRNAIKDYVPAPVEAAKPEPTDAQLSNTDAVVTDDVPF